MPTVMKVFGCHSGPLASKCSAEAIPHGRDGFGHHFSLIFRLILRPRRRLASEASVHGHSGFRGRVSALFPHFRPGGPKASVHGHGGFFSKI